MSSSSGPANQKIKRPTRAKKQKISEFGAINHTITPFWRLMCGLVRLGLKQFWRQALPEDRGLLQLLQQEADELLPALSPADWDSLLLQVNERWQSLLMEKDCSRRISAHSAQIDAQLKLSPLERLIQENRLSLPEVFLLTLLGEVERSHVLNLVVAELQAPQRQARPSVHLCCALIEQLFGPGSYSPLALAESMLIRQHWLQLHGDAPLPLQHVRMAPEHWNLLLGQAHTWPGCTLLESDKNLLPNASISVELLAESLIEQLPTLAQLLRTKAAKGLVVRGHPNSGRKSFSQQLAAQLQLKALLVSTEQWQKEPGLAHVCHLAGWLPVLQPNLGPGEVWRPLQPPQHSPMVILLGSDGAVDVSDFIEIHMSLPAQAQRQTLWMQQLQHYRSTISPKDDTIDANSAESGASLAAIANRVAANALLSGPSIQTLAHQACLLAQRQHAPLNDSHITQARRQLGAERLRLLAQPVEKQIDEAAIVLPRLVHNELERLIERARQRESLWQGLGATLQQTNTAGVRALFTGDSGTGKTLAASYIATRLGAPLYRVDLSAVMNKYIGESEKNLSTLLDMAAASDVALLFDEADSLFGRRSEGKETGERFANMLTHFLLTRIENHPGIVILTSNNRERIDAAFTRRLDLIIDFPQPGFEERLQLWRSHLGERGPGEEAYKLMAGYCNFSGGQLRNVVLAAAALAQGEKITSAHLLAGLEAEYRKIGREVPVKLGQLVLME